VTRIHLLVIDDCEDDAVLIAREFTRAGLDVGYDRADTAAGVAAALAARVPDAVISDYNMPAFRAEEALEQVRVCDPDVPFVLVSGEVGEENAVALMRAGAHDFVLKDRLARLVPAVQRELREAADRRVRRRAESALRASEERFRLLAEHAQDVIFRYRLLPEPAVEYLSPAVTAILGYRPDELLAGPDLLFSLVDPEDRAAFEASWRAPEPGTLTIRWLRRDGRTAWTEQRAVAVTDEAGRLLAVEGILRDVTDRVLAEQERARLERQLRQAERLDSLGQLAGGVAHDFNNLLAVISGYADMLDDELPPDAPCRPDVAGIKQAAARAAALTRQLLIFSRLEPSQPETLDLNAIVADTERLLRRTLGEDIELVTTLDPALRPVTMDRSKLEQVLMNAVVNSRAAMPEGGRLTIATRCLPGASPTASPDICLTITDTGCGMPPEVAARAFEPFYTTKGPGQGTGLGLATAYGAVTEAGGSIALESEPGGGTTVRVRLPAATAAPSRPVPAAGRHRPGNGETVLVVEDEDAVRDIVRRILGNAGYRVCEAASPHAALELCAGAAVRPDVLLTDVIMPGMSGTQLAAALRRDVPDLPVLFMSGYTSGAAPGGQQLPPDAPLVRKPFDAATLLEALHGVLAGAARPQLR
jgi:hypothetical protein